MIVNVHSSSTTSEADRLKFRDMLADYAQNRWNIGGRDLSKLLLSIIDDSTDFIQWFESTHKVTIHHRQLQWEKSEFIREQTVNVFDITEDKHYTLYMVDKA